MSKSIAETLLEKFKDTAMVSISGSQLKIISDTIGNLTNENVKLVEENINIKDKSKVQFILRTINPNYVLRNISVARSSFNSIQQLLEQGSMEIITEGDNIKTDISYIHTGDLELKMNEYYNKKIIELDLKNNDAIKVIRDTHNSELDRIKKDIANLDIYKLQIKELKLQISKEKTTIDIITEQYGELLAESKAYCEKAEFYKNRGFWSRVFNVKHNSDVS